MDDLRLEPTKSTPSIFFDAQRAVLEIKGKSYPENAAKFYEPILDWVSVDPDSLEGVTVQINVEILDLNSSSTKAFLNLFDLLDRWARTGKTVEINWRYHEDNETALECGEEFVEDLEAVKFNLVKIIEE